MPPHHVPDAYAPSRPARSRLPASGVPEPQRPGLGPRLTAAVRPFLVRRSLAAGKGPPPRTTGLGFLGEWVLGLGRGQERWEVPIWAVQASGRPSGEGEDMGLLLFLGLNERRRDGRPVMLSKF